MTKETEATLWSKDGNLSITLFEPIYPSDVEVLKKIKLPRPMTSYRFNKFIKTFKGRAWALEEFDKVYRNIEGDGM